MSKADDDKDFVVYRVEQDDGSWNAQPEYLIIDKTFGLFTWQAHAAHANKMRWLDAVMVTKLCELTPSDGGSSYDYSFKSIRGMRGG